MSTAEVIITEQLLESKLKELESYYSNTLLPSLENFKIRSKNPKLDSDDNKKKNLDLIAKFNEFKLDLLRIKEDIIFLENQQKLRLDYNDKTSSVLIPKLYTKLRGLNDLCKSEEEVFDNYIKTKTKEYEGIYSKLEKKYSFLKDEIDKKIILNAGQLTNTQSELETKIKLKNAHPYETNTKAIQDIDRRKDALNPAQRAQDVEARKNLEELRLAETKSYKELLQNIKTLKQSIELLSNERQKLENEQLQNENIFKSQVDKLRREHVEKQFQLLAEPAIAQKPSLEYTVIFGDCEQFCELFTSKNIKEPLPACITPELLNDFMQSRDTEEYMVKHFIEKSSEYPERLKSHQGANLPNVERLAILGLLRLKRELREEFNRQFGHDLYPDPTVNREKSFDEMEQLKEEYKNKLTPEEKIFIAAKNKQIDKYKEELHQFVTPQGLDRHLKRMDNEIAKFNNKHATLFNSEVLKEKTNAESKLGGEDFKPLKDIEERLKSHEYNASKENVAIFIKKHGDKINDSSGRRLPIETEEQKKLVKELDSLLAIRAEAKKEYDKLNVIKDSPGFAELFKQRNELKRFVDFVNGEDANLLSQRKAIVSEKNEIVHDLESDPLFKNYLDAYVNNRELPLSNDTNLSNKSTPPSSVKELKDSGNTETISSENSPLNSRASSRTGSNASTHSATPSWSKAPSRPYSEGFNRARFGTRADQNKVSSSPHSPLPHVSSPLARESIESSKSHADGDVEEVFKVALPSNNTSSPSLRSSREDLKSSGIQSAWASSPPHSPKKWDAETSMPSLSQSNNSPPKPIENNINSQSEKNKMLEPEELPRTPSVSLRR